MSKKRDWSQLDVEGSDEGSLTHEHEQVEQDIDESLKESKRLATIIQSLSRGQDAILWLKNVAFAVQSRDLEEYLQFRNVAFKRIINQKQGIFKLFMDQQNAVKFVSIPDHVLMNRKFVVQLDSRQDTSHPPAARRFNSYREEQHAPKYRPKEETAELPKPVQPLPPAPAQSSEADELAKLFQQLAIPAEHLQLIQIIRGKK